MGRVGVTVITRQLRYHWDWGHREQLPPPGPKAPPRLVTLTPWERPQEKGIDVTIALDLVEFALTDKFDVAIVVSLDRDLHEIADALRNLRPLIARPIRLEAAVPVRGDRADPKTIKGFRFTHQIHAGGLPACARRHRLHPCRRSLESSRSPGLARGAAEIRKAPVFRRSRGP